MDVFCIVFGASWAVLEAPGAVLGASWGHLGSSKKAWDTSLASLTSGIIGIYGIFGVFSIFDIFGDPRYLGAGILAVWSGDTLGCEGFTPSLREYPPPGLKTAGPRTLEDSDCDS